MWGNLQGWIIATLLLLAMIGGLWWVEQRAAVSPATDFGRSSENLAALQLPVRPQSVVRMGRDADAGAIYRQALSAYDADPKLYQRLIERPSNYRGERLEAMQLIIEAAPCSRMRLFADRPERLINYDNEHPDLELLQALGHLCNQIGLRTNDATEAMRHYEGAFSLGSKLFDERIASAELLAGLALMGEAARGIEQSAATLGDVARAKAAREFERARQQYYNERIEPMLRVLRSIDARVVGRHAGDVYHIASHARERLWRVEATLALGRMRFFIGEGASPGNQRGAMRALQVLSQDADPLVRLAADAAISLTPQQYRMQR